MLKLYGVWCIAFLATFQAGYAIAAMTAIKWVVSLGGGTTLIVSAIPTYQAYCKTALQLEGKT